MIAQADASPRLNWRAMTDVIAAMQSIGREADLSEEELDITIPADEPAGFVCISDVHIGSWSTDHRILTEITDEVLATPGLYIMLVGDMIQMAIRLRSVDEVMDNLLPPSLQFEALDSWLRDVEDRVVLATWDNHSVVREEQLAGTSHYARLMARTCPYFGGIGHPNLIVGGQTYRLAVSHKFRGRSVTNPCMGPMKYLLGDGHHREIAIAGDSHRPGILHFWHGDDERLAINSGTAQIDSRYTKRYYSLYSKAVFPVLELDPFDHRFVAYPDVPTWVRSTKRG